MPLVLIVAGPNGAGKTTFVRSWWSEHGDKANFVNADEIAREIARPGLTDDALNLAAGRRMLQELDALTRARRDIIVETTLATLTYARRIKAWKVAGYRVKLVYLRLPSAEASIARVAKRVAEGGHHIDSEDIRRRLPRSLEYLKTIYRPIVDECEIWESHEGTLRRIE